MAQIAVVPAALSSDHSTHSHHHHKPIPIPMAITSSTKWQPQWSQCYPPGYLPFPIWYVGEALRLPAPNAVF